MTPREYKKVARVGDYLKTNARLDGMLDLFIEGEVAAVNQSSFYLFHNNEEVRSTSPLPYGVYPYSKNYRYAIRISFSNRYGQIERIEGKGPLSILYYDTSVSQ